MGKQYRIEVIVEARAAEAAGRRVAESFRAVDAAANKSADAAEKAADRSAKAETAAAAKAAKARQAEATAGMVSDAQLRQSGMKLRSDLIAAEEAKAARITKSLTQEEIAARVANKRIADDNKRRTMEAMQAANVQYAHTAKLLSKEEIDFKVRNQKILNANQERIESAMKVAGVEYKGARNGWEGVDRLIGSVKTLAASYLGLHAAVGVFKAIGEAAREAAEAQAKMTEGYIRYRDAQRENLDMGGKPMTTKAVIEEAKFAAEAGMKPEEGRAFTEGFMGSGAQYKGKTLPDDQFEEFRRGAAKLATATGIDPAIVGDLAGTMAGSKDYGKAHGKDAGKHALAELNQVIAILQRGRGDNATMAKQASMLSSFALNPDETLGTFNNPKEMATAASVAAEINPQEAEVFTRNAIKAIRPKEGDKAAGLMKKAGVTPQTKFFDAYAKLAPVAMKEARDKRIDLQQLLKNEYGMDEREAKSAAAFINKGVEGGAIADRMKVGDANASPKVAEAKILKAETNVEGPMHMRQAEGRKQVAEMERGAEFQSVPDLMAQATEKMTREKTETNSWGDLAYNMTVGGVGQALGGLPSLEIRRNEEAEGILQKRAKAQGIMLAPTVEGRNGPIAAHQTESAAARDDYFQGRVKEFQEKGGNALVDLTKAQLAEVRKMNAMNAQAGKGPLPVNVGGVGMGR